MCISLQNRGNKDIQSCKQAHISLFCGKRDNLQMCGSELAVGCMQPWVAVNEGCCFYKHLEREIMATWH